MTARFATLADAATIRTTIGAWRGDVSNTDVYSPAAQRIPALADVQANIGDHVVLNTQSGLLVCIITGYREPSYIDGNPAVRLAEILPNPNIPAAQRLTALAAVINELGALLKGVGATRIVAETFNDSRMWLALQTLITQSRIPSFTILGSTPREKNDGSMGTHLYVEWVL